MNLLTPAVLYSIVFVLTIFLVRVALHYRPVDLTRENEIRRGVRLHHLHYGIAISLVATLAALAFPEFTWPWGFLAFGQALIFDEFFPSKYIPQIEPEISQIYLSSRHVTQTYALIIGIIAFTIGFVIR